MRDVAVVGAGLAGLSCARDLMGAGADVVVLEARERVGGRVELARPDGRTLQMGDDVVADFHTAYLDLAAELGLTIELSYASLPGVSTPASEATLGGIWPQRDDGVLSALVPPFYVCGSDQWVAGSMEGAVRTGRAAAAAALSSGLR